MSRKPVECMDQHEGLRHGKVLHDSNILLVGVYTILRDVVHKIHNLIWKNRHFEGFSFRLN